jgi:hypothetical protein
MRIILSVVFVCFVGALVHAQGAGSGGFSWNPACPATSTHIDSNGWTIFCPTVGTGSCGNSSSNYTGTCIVYVSSSTGNDTGCAAVIYNAAIPGTPCKTLSHAMGLMRNGKPDWLLLLRGDSFTPGSGGVFGTWSISGVSATAPMVIGSYDSSQPGVVNPYVAGNRPVIENAIGTDPLQVNSGTGGDYLAIVGIEFYNYTADPNNGSYNAGAWTATTGVIVNNTVNWWLIEDCKFSFYSFNFTFEPNNVTQANSTLIMNRNVIIAAYANSTSINSSGSFLDYTAFYYLTENTFDHNGWNATAAGAAPAVFNHNLYVGCYTPTQFPVYSFMSMSGNISTNDAETSQIRTGGNYINNLFAMVPNGINFGDNGDTFCPSGSQMTYGNVEYNVVESSNSNSAVTGGGGISTKLVIGPTNVAYNLISTFAATSSAGTVSALTINAPGSNQAWSNNTILDWPAKQFDNNSGTGDSFTNNNYNCTTCYSGGTYPDPYRTVGSYYATLSGAVSSASVTGTINNCSPSCSASTTAGNVMNVTAVGAGVLNVGDAIIFPGQSFSVEIMGNANIAPILCGGSNCTGTGGTGTYAVNISINSCSSLWSGCSTAVSVPILASSQTLTDYSLGDYTIGFLEKADTSSKANDLGNAYRACKINDYKRAGFGLAAQGCPTSG